MANKPGTTIKKPAALPKFKTNKPAAAPAKGLKLNTLKKGIITKKGYADIG